MPFDKPTRSSAAEKTTADKKAKGPAKKRRVFGPLRHDPPSTKIETTTVSKQLAKAYDTQFQGLVFHARGILNNENEYRVLGEPYKYFQTSAPSGMPSAIHLCIHIFASGLTHVSFIVNQY